MPSAVPPLPIVDHEHLNRACGGCAELVADLLAKLKTDLPVLREQLLQAGQERQVDVIGEVAHKLQGMAAYTGAMRLGAVAVKLEHAAATGESADITPDFNCVLAEIEALLRQLNRQGS